MNPLNKMYKTFFNRSILIFGILFFGLVSCKRKNHPEDPEPIPAHEVNQEIVDGIHVRTGLKEGEGLLKVIGHCTVCHSAEIIIQNRMDRERWNATIRWMQDTQNLWELGNDQKIIVDYLVTQYPVENKGRRAPLKDVDWYLLNE